MTPEEFDTVVDEALELLPEWVVERIDNLHVIVEEAPTPEQDAFGEGLLGLYEGVSLLDRGNDYFAAAPDRILVFRKNHLALGLSREALRDEILTTVLHEVAHHLGIDDERLHELGWG